MKKAIVFDLDKRDLELWLGCNAPFLFIVYDALNESAYWVDLSLYFEKNRDALEKIIKFVRIYIPAENVLTHKIIQDYRQIKNIQNGKNRYL